MEFDCIAQIGITLFLSMPMTTIVMGVDERNLMRDACTQCRLNREEINQVCKFICELKVNVYVWKCVCMHIRAHVFVCICVYVCM